jgi:hypothetical protein
MTEARTISLTTADWLLASRGLRLGAEIPHDAELWSPPSRSVWQELAEIPGFDERLDRGSAQLAAGRRVEFSPEEGI